jgi:hypothetical protein
MRNNWVVNPCLIKLLVVIQNEMKKHCPLTYKGMPDDRK